MAIFHPSPSPPEQVLRRDDDVIEKQLAELGVSGDLGHRPDFDAGRGHVDDQHRDPATAGHGVVGSRQESAPRAY